MSLPVADTLGTVLRNFQERRKKLFCALLLSVILIFAITLLHFVLIVNPDLVTVRIRSLLNFLQIPHT